MRKSPFLAAGMAALLGASPAAAQNADGSEEDATELPQLLVTAGRTPVEQEKSGRAFTVVEGEQIERSQTRYVAEALRQVPGLHVSRTGGYGGLVQLRVRGAEGNHVLVLIDGVEVSSTSEGEFDFGGLLADDIERIEVLRGPQSAFWGSDALAGVVNIITRRGPRDGFETGGQAEYGGDNTRAYSGFVRGGTENLDASISASKRVTDGFNISDFGNESDGATNATFNGRFNWDIFPGASVDGTLRYVDRTGETDNQPFASPVLDTDNETKTEDLYGSLGFTGETPDGAWIQRGRFMITDLRRENFTNGVRSSGTEGERYKALYQITHRLDDPAGNRHSLTGGYEWERETFRAIPPVFDPSQLVTQMRDLHSLVGEYRGEFADQFFLNGGIRRDFNDQFQDATTYSVAAAWAVPGTGTRLHGSVGTGVKNPTFFEQFGFIPANFVGNPSLTPEFSFGWDVGVEQTLAGGDLVFDVTYFQQDLTDEIVTDFTVFPFTARNQTGTSERHGWEVSLRAIVFDGLSVGANYTYTHARNPDGTREVRRPEHSGSVRADYVFPNRGATLFAEAIFNGETPDNDFSTFPATPVFLEAYTVVNAGGSFRLTGNIELYGRVENLLDEQYEEIAGYNTQRRTAYAGIKGRF